MRFEARELKSYAEPVSISDLREGEVYFSVQFADENLLVPIVQPLVFVGRNLVEGDGDLLYFQDFESYSMGVRYASASDGDATAFQVRGPDDTKHIFEYERALDTLLKCSLRRHGT
jgi:hypothetical protein